MKHKKKLTLLGDIIGILGAVVIFIIPFVFMLVNSLKDRRSANLLRIDLPETVHWENFVEVFRANNYQLLTAFKNSFLIMAGTVIIPVSYTHLDVYKRQEKKVTGQKVCL